jgi:DNA (cytosine-5)-methyltransferase 1
MTNKIKLKVLDLFSGIGGFSLGLESTGFFETIGFVEKDNFCQKVLKKHWSNINIEGDIRNVKGERYAADVVTGGFPCQPFSSAGKRKSTADDRYLWDEMLRVIRETKPRWVIGENVEGIVNINEGMVLRQVLNDLENEGFKSQCIIIPASGIGAWHQRKRIWIIANSNNTRIRTSKHDIDEKRKKVNERQKEVLQSEPNRYNKNVPNSNSFMPHGSSSSTRNSKTEQSRLECNKSWNWNKIWSKTNGCNKQVGKGNVPNSSFKGLQGCSIQHNLEGEQRSEELNVKTSSERQQTWWETQSELCGVPNGISFELDKDRSNRIKSLGNSIVPQIARQIGLSIMQAENGN